MSAGEGREALEAPVTFDLRLPALTLDHGGRVDPLVVRGWLWTTGARTFLEPCAAEVVAPSVAGHVVVRNGAADGRRPVARAPAARPDSPPDERPTVLVVHALTGDAAAGGEGGWWAPVIGPGRAFDPARHRVLCFNNLGSCYGTSSPSDEGFAAGPVTTWDQARTILAALDALGISTVDLVTGGSLGGMVALCLAALAPGRFARVVPIAACAAASSWIIGFNHVQRRAMDIAADPGEGLALAREIAMLTYRAEPGLDDRQGRQRRGNLYRMQTYLAHQGRKLVGRFAAVSYRAMMDAMDSHDIGHPPAHRDDFERWSWPPQGPQGLDRITASCLSIGIDTDQLFFPIHAREIADGLAARGRVAEHATIRSRHGHDGFLIEWDQLEALLVRALALPRAETP